MAKLGSGIKKSYKKPILVTADKNESAAPTQAESHAGKPAASFCDVATMRSRHGRALAAKTATNHSQDRWHSLSTMTIENY